jgi:hypothetical protein
VERRSERQRAGGNDVDTDEGRGTISAGRVGAWTMPGRSGGSPEGDLPSVSGDAGCWRPRREVSAGRATGAAGTAMRASRHGRDGVGTGVGGAVK